MTYRSIRIASVAAILAAFVGLALTPFMATAAVFSPSIVWDEMATPFTRFFGPLLEDSGALTFGDDGTAYEVYGKAFFLAYLLLVPIVRLVHRVYRTVGGSSMIELRSWWVMYAALLAALVGDFISYWALSVPGSIGEAAAVVGFLVEFNATILLLLGTAVYAWVAVHFSVLPRWAGWLLIAIFPVGWAIGSHVVDYIPNALTVPYSMGWAAIGVWLLVAGNKDSNSPWPLRIVSQSGPAMTAGTVISRYWVTGLSLIFGVFMVVFGLLLALSDDADGWFGIGYGIVGVVCGAAIVTTLYLLGTQRITPSSGRRTVAVSVGVAAIGYFWAVVPLVLGLIIGWFGIHRNRTTSELGTPDATREIAETIRP
jgi:hypothetical protein